MNFNLRSHNIKFTLFSILAFMSISSMLYSQNLDLPRVSPGAEISQKVGLSEIIINYSRPAVNGRQIWGRLIPYNNGIPFPWRAGANENTTINFTHNVKINGTEIPAGEYSFHIIPSENNWILIFNSQHKAWGSFFYDKSKDVLRVDVIPERIHFNEWLEYRFEKITSNSVDICMHWERLNIRFTAEFDEVQVVLNSIREQLSSLPGFSWQGPMQAAQYCVDNEVNYDEALVWIDQSIRRNSNFSNNIVKVELLKKMNKKDEAKDLEASAFENATENELNLYGYQLLNKNLVEEAKEVFLLNIKRFPGSWNVYDSYGEALNLSGDNAGAIENYEVALSKAPEDQKERILQILETLNSN